MDEATSDRVRVGWMRWIGGLGWVDWVGRVGWIGWATWREWGEGWLSGVDSVAGVIRDAGNIGPASIDEVIQIREQKGRRDSRKLDSRLFVCVP